MPQFKIYSSWEMYGSQYIEANTLDEAIAIAESDACPLPVNGSYVQESHNVDHAVTDDENDN
jgi:hypothetical protein